MYIPCTVYRTVLRTSIANCTSYMSYVAQSRAAHASSSNSTLYSIYIQNQF
jgi:hypothetical protein